MKSKTYDQKSQYSALIRDQVDNLPLSFFFCFLVRQGFIVNAYGGHTIFKCLIADQRNIREFRDDLVLASKQLQIIFGRWKLIDGHDGRKLKRVAF